MDRGNGELWANPPTGDTNSGTPLTASVTAGSLDEAIGRFGSMSIGGDVAVKSTEYHFDTGATAGTSTLEAAAIAYRQQQQREQQQQQQQQQYQQMQQQNVRAGGVVGLDLGSLQLIDEAAAALTNGVGGDDGNGVEHQHHVRPPLENQAMSRQGDLHGAHPHQQHQLQTQIVAVSGTASAVGGWGTGMGGKGADGVWVDELGRRLYTEDEVRQALEQEGRGWRERAVTLEASLVQMESDARGALAKAEQAMAEMAEKLRASEGKTYALTVHLAQSNRPHHLA